MNLTFPTAVVWHFGGTGNLDQSSSLHEPHFCHLSCMTFLGEQEIWISHHHYMNFTLATAVVWHFWWTGGLNQSSSLHVPHTCHHSCVMFWGNRKFGSVIITTWTSLLPPQLYDVFGSVIFATWTSFKTLATVLCHVRVEEKCLSVKTSHFEIRNILVVGEFLIRCWEVRGTLEFAVGGGFTGSVIISFGRNYIYVNLGREPKSHEWVSTFGELVEVKWGNELAPHSLVVIVFVIFVVHLQVGQWLFFLCACVLRRLKCCVNTGICVMWA